VYKWLWECRTHGHELGRNTVAGSLQIGFVEPVFASFDPAASMKSRFAGETRLDGG